MQAEYDGKAKVGKVNVDEETGLAQQFQVMSIPTIVLMKNGKVINQLIGVRSKAELESLLSSICKYKGGMVVQRYANTYL